VIRENPSDSIKQKDKTAIFWKITPPSLGSSMEIRKLRENFSPLYDSFKKRRLDTSELDRFVEKDREWRNLQKRIEELRAEKNKCSRKISSSKTIDKDTVAKAKELANKILELEARAAKVSEERRMLLLSLPNILLDSVPLEKEVAICFLGKPKVSADKVEEFKKAYPNLEFSISKNVKSQYDIIKEYCLVDEEKGAELAGSRFYYKTNELVLLDVALAFYAIMKLSKQKFRLISPPYLVKKIVEEGATTLDAFEEALYKIEGEDLYLIPTSEHPIAAYNNNKVFKEEELPIRYFGFSPSFRKEAGAHGKDTKGIFRNHHFNKVEQYVICTPQQAENEFNMLIRNQAELLYELGIPVRVTVLPAWDMDKKALIQADVEGWWPVQNKYRELGSHGYMGSWQGVRFNIKYIPNDKKGIEYVHTIYGTYVATERALACMLENALDENGIIHIPKVLADYVQMDEILPKRVKK
jgi:seryl-tRNA synthetase